MSQIWMIAEGIKGGKCPLFSNPWIIVSALKVEAAHWCFVISEGGPKCRYITKCFILPSSSKWSLGEKYRFYSAKNCNGNVASDFRCTLTIKEKKKVWWTVTSAGFFYYSKPCLQNQEVSLIVMCPFSSTYWFPIELNCCINMQYC